MIMKKFIPISVLLGSLLAIPCVGGERLPTIPASQYDSDQKAAATAFQQARGVPVFGPFEPLMYSPEVMTVARSMGDYLRYHSAIGNKLSEFAILLTAREWSQNYEWYVHYPIALKVGIRPETAKAIWDQQRPENMEPDEELIYTFATELFKTHHVSDSIFSRAEHRFGKKGVVDLTGILGYYTFLAMEMNVAQYPVPGETKRMP
jgi:4-carboxymuconolactone decarboxylase